MALLDYAGYVAAVCTTGAYVPQVLKVWRTRATKDISLKMIAVLVTGLVLWLAYGIHKGEVPLVLANSITLGLADGWRLGVSKTLERQNAALVMTEPIAA